MMLEILNTFIGEIIKLAINSDPNKRSPSHIKKLKSGLARLYFLLIDWQECGNEFIDALEETMKSKNRFDYNSNLSESLFWLRRLNQIVIDISDLLVTRMGKSYSLIDLLTFQDDELGTDIWVLLGLKDRRIQEWVELLNINLNEIDNSAKRLYQVSNKDMKKTKFRPNKLHSLNIGFSKAEEFWNIDIKKSFCSIELNNSTIQQEIKIGRRILRDLHSLLEDYKSLLYKQVSMEDLL